MGNQKKQSENNQKNILVKLSNLFGGAQFVMADKASPRRGAFRRGVATLLEGVIELGSLDKAAKTLYMGDSTARRVLAETERSLGFELVETFGRHGSRPTREGQLLLDIYHQEDLELKTFASMRFDEIIADGGVIATRGSLERVLFGFHDNLPALLLKEIEDTGSVKQAAKKMGISQKKVKEMLVGIESSLGYPLINSHRHGVLTLTPDGKKFMDCSQALYGAIVEQGNWSDNAKKP